jgi:hypothetical protein
MNTTSARLLVIGCLAAACGGKLLDETSPVRATPPPPAATPGARPASTACPVAAGEVTVSDHAVVGKVSATGCRLAVHERTPAGGEALVVVSSDGSERARVAERLDSHPLAPGVALFEWLGDTLVYIADGNLLLARDDGGRGPARELARGARELRSSHDARFVVYTEDVGAPHRAIRAVPVAGGRPVTIADTAGLTLNAIETAGPPGETVAVVRPQRPCDACDSLEGAGCGDVRVVALDPDAPGGTFAGPARLLAVSPASASLIVDLWSSDGTHRVYLTRAGDLSRTVLLAQRAAARRIAQTEGGKADCEHARATFAPSGAHFAITLSDVTTSWGSDWGATHTRTTAMHRYAVEGGRAISLGPVDPLVGGVVTTSDTGLVLTGGNADVLELVLQPWGGPSIELARIPGGANPVLVELSPDRWLVAPTEHGRPSSVVSLTGGSPTRVDVVGDQPRRFDRWFTLNATEGVAPVHAGEPGPTHVYRTATLERLTTIEKEGLVAGILADGAVVAIASPRLSPVPRRLSLRAVR